MFPHKVLVTHVVPQVHRLYAHEWQVKFYLEGHVFLTDARSYGNCILALGANPTPTRDSGIGCVSNIGYGELAERDVFLPGGVILDDGQALFINRNVHVNNLAKHLSIFY